MKLYSAVVYRGVCSVNKLDLILQDAAYYSPSTEPSTITLGHLPYLTLTGQGSPSCKQFADAAQALFAAAYAIKTACKQKGQDFTVPKLEGKWWVEGNTPALEVPRNRWHWRIAIRMPDFVNQDYFEQARERTIAKKTDLLRVPDVQLEYLDEGTCAHVMHVGPYATEPATMQRLESYIEDQGLRRRGNYHLEVYLSDPRKTYPAKLKTILRIPVQPV